MSPRPAKLKVVVDDIEKKQALQKQQLKQQPIAQSEIIKLPEQIQSASSEQQNTNETPSLGSDEQAFLAKLQQRAEKCKPDNLFATYLKDSGLNVKRIRVKGIDFIAGGSGKTYALIFSNSNKDEAVFKLDSLEPITEFHTSFGFMPLVAVFWRPRKLKKYRIMSLSDGEVRIYKLGDLAHNLKEKTFTAHKNKGISMQNFQWK